MTETYTQEELARAWKDLDTTLTEYNMDRLERICVQARKNRLWEAHGNEVQVQSGNASIDQVRERLNLPPWKLRETSEPIVFTPQGPVPFSEVPEMLKKAALSKDLGENDGTSSR